MGTVHALDSAGAGVAGAKVVLNRSSGGGGTRTPVDSAVTDAQGAFAFPSAAAGNYGVVITATGIRPLPATTSTSPPARRDTLRIVLILPYGPASILGTVRGPDSTGPLLPNAMVGLEQARNHCRHPRQRGLDQNRCSGKVRVRQSSRHGKLRHRHRPSNATVRAYSDHNIDFAA